MKPRIFVLGKRTIKRSDIQLGPIIHKQLSPDLEERIRKLEPVFADVYPNSHQKWLEGFQRDLDPESEVRIWESISSTYQSFLTKQALILPAKKEVLGLLVSAAGSEEETLARAKLCYLSRREASELLRLYAATLAESQRTSSFNCLD